MNKINKLSYLLILVLTILVAPSLAQNKISMLRYDDDFSLLKINSHKKGLDHLKYISFGNK